MVQLRPHEGKKIHQILLNYVYSSKTGKLISQKQLYTLSRKKIAAEIKRDIPVFFKNNANKESEFLGFIEYRLYETWLVEYEKLHHPFLSPVTVKNFLKNKPLEKIEPFAKIKWRYYKEPFKTFLPVTYNEKQAICNKGFQILHEDFFSNREAKDCLRYLCFFRKQKPVYFDYFLKERK